MKGMPCRFAMIGDSSVGIGNSNPVPATTAPPVPRARLLERDAPLVTLGSFWAEALAGRGRFVFLGGEGGAGKTSVAVEFAQRVAGRGRFLVGSCDAGATPRALGPLIDVADVLGVGAGLSEPDVRRASLFPLVRAALGRTPTVLLLEDVQWADEATLDLIRFLGRRLDGQPVLVIATFRDDEVTSTHPLAGVMGDLATAASVRRLHLPLLTAAAVAELARDVGREVDVAALHCSTDGNPFFVTEVLASGAESIPATVRDAVAARAARLTVPARRALDTAAVVVRWPRSVSCSMLRSSRPRRWTSAFGAACCSIGELRSRFGTSWPGRRSWTACRRRPGRICIAGYWPDSRPPAALIIAG